VRPIWMELVLCQPAWICAIEKEGMMMNCSLEFLPLSYFSFLSVHHIWRGEWTNYEFFEQSILLSVSVE